jgi:hypothetical protein
MFDTRRMVAPMMAVATDFSGKNSDRMPIIFQL